MKEPLVSVVIPVHNGEEFITKTLNALLSQSYKHYEIIIVNDGSTDKTYQVLEKFFVQYSNIRVIDQNQKGVSSARNRGLHESKGKYVVFFDADDICSKDFLKSRVEALESQVNAGFSCGEVLAFHGITSNIKSKTLGVTTDIARKILFYDQDYSTVPSNYMFRVELLQLHGIVFDERLSSTADRLFLLEVAKYASGTFVLNAPLYYRLHPNSMTAQLTKKLILDNEKFFQALHEKNLIPTEINKEVRYLHFKIFAKSYAKIFCIRTFYWLKIGLKECGLSFLKFVLK